MDILNKVFQQTSWQLIGKFVTSLSAIIILGLVSRNFGESGTGILTLALTYLGFFSLAADFGINAHILPRLLVRHPDIIWRKLLGLRIILAGLLVVLATLLILFWPSQEPTFKQSVLLGLLLIVESAIFISAIAIFQSKLRYDLAVLATVSGTFITVAAMFLLVKTGSVPALMIGYILGLLITALVALILVRKFVNNLWPIFDIRFSLNTIKKVWPITTTLLVNLVYFRVDAFLLSHFRTFAEVGIYNLSYQIFQSVLVLPSFIMNSFYPMMLKDFSDSSSKFRLNLLKLGLVMAAIGILGIIFTLILAPLVIQLITGAHGFSGSVNSLQILSLGFPAFFVSSLLMWSLITMKKYQIVLLIYLIGLVINASLNWIFIPKYSYIAASLITATSEYLILILQIITLARLWKK